MATTSDPDSRLNKCPEVPVSTNMPGPVSERLDLLVGEANDAGAATFRKELLAALILRAPETGSELFDLVLDYRRALAKEAALKSGSADVLDFRRHKRGPRPKGLAG
jgi:hypothetical protein